jgi:hypothetical protein
MTPEAVGQRLARAGFRSLQIRQNGNVYLVDANDKGGRPLRLVVDGKDGAILQRFALAAPRAGAQDGGVAPPAPGFAPQQGAPAEGAPNGARPRPQTPAASRSKPAASEATAAPSPGAQDPSEPAAQPPLAAAARATPAPAPMPSPAPAPVLVGPGFANGVPINPLD